MTETRQQGEERGQRNAGGRVRFEGIEAYRGIAALLLVLFHAYQYSREGTGAAAYVYEGTPWHVFFSGLRLSGWFLVLSGFLIFLPFARDAVSGEGRRSVRSFLIRRMIRILPVYYVAILIVWTWRYFGSPEQWVDLLEHLTFTQVFSREHIFWTIGTSWTLALVVQSYVFMAIIGPLAYWVCSKLEKPSTRAALLVGVVVALGAFSVVYKWWAFYVVGIPEENWPVYFGPLAFLDSLALGMLLAITVAAAGGREKMGGFAAALLTLTGIALMAATIVYRPDSEAVELYFHVLASLAFTLVLAATVMGPRDSLRMRVLDRPTLRYLGLISYSIFLWHEPIMMELGKRGILISTAPEAFPRNAIILVILSIAVGALSYVALERPALRLRNLFDREGRLLQRYPNLSGAGRET